MPRYLAVSKVKNAWLLPTCEPLAAASWDEGSTMDRAGDTGLGETDDMHSGA